MILAFYRLDNQSCAGHYEALWVGSRHERSVTQLADLLCLCSFRGYEYQAGIDNRVSIDAFSAVSSDSDFNGPAVKWVCDHDLGYKLTFIRRKDHKI